MTERIKDKQEEPEQERPAGEYYVVNTRIDMFYVSSDTARRLGLQMDRRWMRPRWLKFIDISGARVWVRSDTLESIAECTESNRAFGRYFQRAIRREEQADRRWEEE